MNDFLSSLSEQFENLPKKTRPKILSNFSLTKTPTPFLEVVIELQALVDIKATFLDGSPFSFVIKKAKDLERLYILPKILRRPLFQLWG